MSTKCSVDEMADKINVIMTDYSTALSSDVKKAVRKTANKVRKEIRSTAPERKGGGDYKRSWATKTTLETSYSLEVTVYAQKPEYRLAHLLEKGHAKRNGGRVAAIPHIAPAEEMGQEMLETEIGKACNGT